MWVLVGHARVRVWHDDLTLWVDAMRKAPAKARPIVNVARALQDRSPDDPRIVPLYRRGANAAASTTGISAVQQRDWHALALANEARYWRLHGDYEQAERLASAALQEVPYLMFARAEWVLARLLRHCTLEGTTWKCDASMPTPPPLS